MEKADFMQALEAAVTAKAAEADGKRLPQMLESYRLLHTCEKNLFELLVKRSLVKEDPYKLEKKVNKIETPDMSTFNETETATIMGIRLSDYDTMLDYICAYLPVNTQSLTESKVKKLLEFNTCIDWANLSPASSGVNTRIFCQLISAVRNGAQQMTQRLIIDSLNNAKKALNDVNATLNDMAVFAHEKTKYDVRRLVMGNSLFDNDKAAQGGEAERSEIKRLWQAGMDKMPYNNELVLEIVAEDCDSNKDALQQAVLSRLKTSGGTEKADKKKKEDPKTLLIDGAVILAASAPQIEEVLRKVAANHDVLVASRATLFEKFKALLRRAFGIPDPPEEYILNIVNPKTQAAAARRIDYNEFVEALEKRLKVYSLMGVRTSTQYARVAASTTGTLYSFVTKQVSEMQDLMVMLNALDEYFKTNVGKGDKSRIKGLKIELATIGNCVVKARGRCQDFSAAMEDAKTMQEHGAAKPAAPSAAATEGSK